MDDLKLKNLLDPPANAAPPWFRQRGRDFERVLTQMLSRENMEPRTSMRPDGEEIDGSFAIGDRFFLLEAKWHAVPIAASALYAFKGKVDGKFIGTVGIFFSMSDYSTDAVDALLAGKELNLILFGKKDLLLIEEGKLTMREAMRVKMRYAADYGQPFFPLESHLAEQVGLKHEAPISKPKQEWTIVVESEDDVRTIEELLNRFQTLLPIAVYAAGGQLSVAPLAEHLRRTGNTHVAAIVTPMPDAELQQEHIEKLKASGAELISLREPLEDWLGNYVAADYYNQVFMLTNRNGKMARRFARNADIGKLLTANPTFAELMSKLDAQPK